MAATPRQPETAASAAQPAHPETGEQEHPKRLPGLWIICVLLGLSGMVSVSALFSATTLGLAFFGAVALIYFAAAAGLWCRSNIVRIVVMLLLALNCVRIMVLWIQDITEVDLIIAFAGSAAVIAYLWARRDYFKVPHGQRPGSRSVRALVALSFVLIPGAALILLLNVDDKPRRFPQLEIERAKVADDENAFVVLQNLVDRFPMLQEDDDIDDLLYDLPEGWRPGKPEWNRKAREVLERYEAPLASVDEILARPHFVPPWPEDYLELLYLEQDWLTYSRRLARLMSIQSQLQLVEGSPAAALSTAEKTVELGLMVSGGDHFVINYLVGNAIFAIGLCQIRHVTDSEQISPGLLAPCIGRLEVSRRLKANVARALAREFDCQRLAFESLARLDVLKEVMSAQGLPLEAPGSDWRHRLPDRVPLVKVNMSVNLAGDYLAETADRLDHYGGPRPDPAPDGLGSLVAEVGLLHFLRNPIGDVLMVMLAPAHEAVRRQHFRAVADARVTQVFLALRCYHLENGRLPETLDELAPEYFDQVPVDPFTEQAFRYEPDADPPRLVSLGPDQTLDQPDAWEDDLVVELAFAAP